MNPARALLVAASIAGVASAPVRALQPAPKGAPSRLVRELTLGASSSASDVPGGFTGIGTVLVGPTGDIYVAQPADNVIRRFDSTGRYVGDIGHKGQGPGETERLGRAGFVGDTLWTVDWMTHRFSLFSPNGVYYSTFRAEDIPAARPMFLNATELLADGKVLYNSMSMASQVGTAGMPPIPVVIASRILGSLDTLATLNQVDRTSFGFQSGNGSVFFGDNALGALLYTNPRIAFGGGGAWFVIALQAQCSVHDSYRIARVSIRGDTLWRAAVPCKRVPVPRGFLDSVVAVNRDRALKGRPGISPSYAEQQIREKLGPVTSFGTLADMQVGRDGSIWIRPLSLQAGPEEWTRVDAKAGAPERIVLPPKTQLKLIIDSTRFWAAEKDEDDVQTLVRYRVIR